MLMRKAPQAGTVCLKSRGKRIFSLRSCFLLATLAIVLGPSVAPAAQGAGSGGQDFGREARLLYRVVACGGNAKLPLTLDPHIVARHCRWLNARIGEYRRQYLVRARPFFAAVVPSQLPDSVVYPFGGGDLLAALTTYPQAREITTLSLELSGDPRRILRIDNKELKESLEFLDQKLIWLLALNESTSENLEATQRGDLPGQLCFFLVGLAVHGYEPVSLRYFRVEADGSPHYYSAEEIHTLETRLAQRRHGQWTPPDFSEAFANSELTFRPIGGDGPLRIHRHIAVNLRNDYLKKNSPVLRYLERQGRVAAMTKAASYCLWNPLFSRIRNYLLANMDFMISDSTGIPPDLARKAGFVQETYGTFHGSFLDASQEYNDQFRELWAQQPHRKLSFRYGYVDSEKCYHLLVTRRAPHPTS
jgi:hypothetical protein